jgi:hypothetical protein
MGENKDKNDLDLWKKRIINRSVSIVERIKLNIDHFER